MRPLLLNLYSGLPCPPLLSCTKPLVGARTPLETKNAICFASVNYSLHSPLFPLAIIPMAHLPELWLSQQRGLPVHWIPQVCCQPPLIDPSSGNWHSVFHYSTDLDSGLATPTSTRVPFFHSLFLGGCPFFDSLVWFWSRLGTIQ